MHLVQFSKVAEESSEQLDVRLGVKKVLVAHHLGWGVSNCLLKGGGTLTSLIHESIVDHLASIALKVLHLIGDNSAVQQLVEALLDSQETERMSTCAVPYERNGVASVVHLVELIQVIVAANVYVLNLEAALTDDIWKNKD